MYCKIRPTAFLIFSVFFNSYTIAINVQCPVKRHVVMLFQPVTLQCQYQTSDTNPPLITWKYKSFCRDPIEMALSPSSSDNALAQSNPNYDPVTECPDIQRTVRIVASKRISVTLAAEYQGRKISIINNADLNIAQTAWGDSGVYLCTVASDQDLTGNGECYTELIVLERKANTTDWLPGIDLLVMEDKLLVALVVIGFLLLVLLIGICWCQCCPHSCCCYVSCPCCPERCCCPRALYEAGKAIKSGVPSHYAPTLYAPSMYAQPIHGLGGGSPAIPMLPMPPMHPATNYRDYDHASSVGQGSQVPLLQDNDGGGQTRSGYRIQANPDGNPTRVLYYMERELTNLEPGHPGDAAGKYNRLDGMSEVTSLHEMSEPRSHGHSRPPQLPTLYDDPDDRMSTISSVSQHQRPRRHNDSPMNHGARGRARSMDNLDVIYQHSNDDDYPQNYKSGARGGRRGSDDGWNRDTRDDYDHETDRHYHRRNHSPDSHGQNRGRGAGFQQRRSRSRDDLMAMDRNDRGNEYDDRLLREALAKKKLGSQDRLDHSGEKRPMNGHYGPPPLPVSPPSGYPEHFPSSLPYDQESTASSKKSNLRKNGAVSRESLVV